MVALQTYLGGGVATAAHFRMIMLQPSHAVALSGTSSRVRVVVTLYDFVSR